MTDLILVPEWLLIVLFLVGFILGYFGDVFLSRSKE